MDTVKVDIQKLQLLNERIAQTLDALNQVRMSMQGFQHTSIPTPPWAAYGGYAPAPFVQPPYGMPFAPFAPFGAYNGISHTSWDPTFQTRMPWTPSPWTTSPWTPTTWPQTWTTPFTFA